MRALLTRSAALPALGAALLALALGGCKGEADAPPRSRGEEERTIVTLQSYVYATAEESGFRTAARIREQIKSAFGALKSLRVTASNQEVERGMEEQLYKEPLVLVSEQGRETVVFRVWFRYTDEVFASAAVQRGVPILVGGLHRQDDARFTQIVTACTANTAREREYRSRVQAVFDGSLSTCQDAILGEQAVIDAARVRLDTPEDEVVPEEVNRTYLPVVARLLARKASQMASYPRFEPVVPQAGRGVVAAAPGGRARGTDTAAYEDPAGDGTAAPGVVVVPGSGVPGQPQPVVKSDEEEDPDAPPDPQAGVPVIAAGGAKGPALPPQPRRGDEESAFNWEDLADKKYWVLWIAVFALYPLLRRRPSDG